MIIDIIKTCSENHNATSGRESPQYVVVKY